MDCCGKIPTIQENWNFKNKILQLGNTAKDWFKKKPESNYLKHARRELIALGYDLDQKEENPNKWIVEDLFELLKVFSKQGHSGNSAPYCVSIFKKLALFEPLCPLTGDYFEWNKIDNDTWQNIRCGHVFKGADGKAYDTDGKIFREPDGCCYTSSDSYVFIKFPYVPKREYIDVPKHVDD